MPKFERKSKADSRIPTASMADIAFLLLIFFMAITTFVVYKGLPVHMPFAEQSQRLQDKRNLAYLWIDQTGQVSIDDRLVGTEAVRFIMNSKLVANPFTIVSMKIDRKTEYGVVHRVLEELRRAGALRVNFATAMNE
jgi:biopolymer transport protein ExbD